MSLYSFVVYIITVITMNFFGVSAISYFSFAFFLMECFIKYKKSKNKIYVLCMLLASIILNNNFVIYAVLLLIMVSQFDFKLKFKISIFSIIFGVYILLNVLFNDKMIVNLVFSIFFYLPLFICHFNLKKISISNSDYNIFLDFLKKSIIIQATAVVSCLIFNFSTVMGSIDNDWVAGTFGTYQGNIFLFYCAFACIIFLRECILNKSCYVYMFLSLFLVILTGSIALIFMFAGAFVCYFLSSSQVKLKTKLISIVVLMFGLALFLVITPAWIKNYVVRLVATDDKTEFVSKLDDYENAFIDLPKEDVKYKIIGCGLGQYSSRSALTCTGKYYSFYESLFSVSMSKYTRDYIYEKLIYIYENRLGSMDTPYSSLISVRAELGLVGLVFLIIYFTSLLRESKGLSKIYILLFIFSCFIENYLEFAKVVSLVYIIRLFFLLNERK